MSSTVHLGKGRSVTFNDHTEYVDPTVADPARVRSESVRVMLDRATHARLKLAAFNRKTGLAHLLREQIDAAIVQSEKKFGKSPVMDWRTNPPEKSTASASKAENESLPQRKSGERQ